MFWQGIGFFKQKEAVAYNSDNNIDGAGSGGTGMWVSPKILYIVSNTGHNTGGYAQWIKLQGVPRGNLMLLNIYAPHTSVECCALWIELLGSLPRDCRWIFMGDWNFVEDQQDKSNNRASTIFGEEK
jgi:hypothetical protein